MAIIAKAENSDGSKFLHPEGQFTGRCIDVIDHGYVDTFWQGVKQVKHKITIRFYAGEHNEEGKPLFVNSRFTLSLHENSALRPFLESWRAKKFTQAELEGFDVEVLIGVSALLSVIHNEKDGKTYANIMTAMKLPKGMESPYELPDYVRVCDRPKEDAKPVPVAVAGPSTPWDGDDDDLPF